mmetsp:Transcript_1997/g.3463  ORF Transcript_1997/g.3463 Transcript_1997/m.3463 type:complete len:103 (-) Transcript_1997:82-390(-)
MMASRGLRCVALAAAFGSVAASPCEEAAVKAFGNTHCHRPAENTEGCSATCSDLWQNVVTICGQPDATLACSALPNWKVPPGWNCLKAINAIAEKWSSDCTR